MIQCRTFDLPPINRKEVLRYAGTREEPPEIARLLDSALAEAEPVLSGTVCWLEFPLTRQDGMLHLGFAVIQSDALQRNLQDCDRIVLFAATVGLGLDRLIARYSRVSPSRALMLQAIGAERIEALCDAFCEEVRQTAQAAGLHTVPRFSPGYGDFPIAVQTEIFQVLDCSRKIGLTLNQSLLMSPSKSVTAVIGLGACASCTNPTGCQSCGKTDCIYRRTT